MKIENALSVTQGNITVTFTGAKLTITVDHGRGRIDHLAITVAEMQRIGEMVRHIAQALPKGPPA
jgi:hypothetical protein